ncbi:hypothetical protein KL905_002622 [Ogataea polymorpha]|uniref:Uncharacterized protein n=2 Tax=Saccharomycotina TaxID=147537 RepID=A0A9P8T078_9ASCO|nr:hypothetical protein KL908_001893 [Ogataea polymorpha]KAG7899887.1 hypothetical protein KL935_003428 [Ogataea polymorpha]KAG7906726.1 hypothetical protein KL907_002366 [Ogataea polymorpha]KAG7909973.1 hypothetical protein KL906_001878 [Ogataea polymorpha]KAG7917673.1 hypothetical protein KL927_002416 [Ogataea polymorpha]
MTSSITLCIPSSCISRRSCKNLEQATFTAYQIARAACTYNVGEIVILDVPETIEAEESNKIKFEEKGISASDSSRILAALLQFFTTPSYLVKTVFQASVIEYFKIAKKLPKISTLPYMQNAAASSFREGISIPKKSVVKKTAEGKVLKKKKPTTTKFVNIGDRKMLELEEEIPINTRVTVNMKTKRVVSPDDAYGKAGALRTFGYHVRVATKLSSVFTEPGYTEGYDRCIYVSSGDYFSNEQPATELPSYQKETDKRLLLVVAKWNDINKAFKSETIEGVSEPKQMMDCRLEIPLGTRIEDGVLISLAML